MSREFSFYLEDILECCRRIIHYTADLSFDQFVEDNLTYDAVLRNIEIIGEAAKQVPTEIRDQYPSVEWRRIAGMRDIVAHHYFSIHDEIVWDIIENKIPDLQKDIKILLENIE